MEYVSRFLVHTYIEYDGKLDVEEFIDQGMLKLSGVGEMDNAAEAFNTTFDLLNASHGTNALRRFHNGVPTGRYLPSLDKVVWEKSEAAGVEEAFSSLQVKSFRCLRPRLDLAAERAFRHESGCQGV
jgi:hypothetical protein